MRVSYALVLAAAALGAATVTPAIASADATGSSAYTALPGSTGPAPGRVTGRYGTSRMTVEVSLVPRDKASTARTAKSVEAYLRGQGLAAGPGASPALVRAQGSSAQVSRAFRTTLSTYIAPNGGRYYANSTPVYVPASLARQIVGVLGLSDTQHARPLAR